MAHTVSAQRARPAPLARRVLHLDRFPDQVAWKLVEALHGQRASLVISGLIGVGFGAISYCGTGTAWYLAGVAYTILVTTWRLLESAAFARRPESDSPTAWALRNLCAAWAAAAGWAAWTIVIPYEPKPEISAMVLGLHAGLISGGAIRNNGVPAVAIGQILIAAGPLCIACLAASSLYLRCYSGLVVLFMLASSAMIRSLNRQTVQLLLKQQEAIDLADELALANQRLSEQVATDPLTNLLNRRALDLVAAHEWRAALREKRPLSVLMIDIDHFKKFNDHYGHQAGDQCIRDVAAILKSVLRRPNDVIGRYGGEEFIAILPSVDMIDPVYVAENLLAELSRRALPHEATQHGRVSASVGVACSDATHINTIFDLIGSADDALYVAKRRGRNQVFAHSELAANDEAPLPEQRLLQVGR